MCDRGEDNLRDVYLSRHADRVAELWTIGMPLHRVGDLVAWAESLGVEVRLEPFGDREVVPVAGHDTPPPKPEEVAK